jgi:predicted nucleic acid-binding protein
MAPELLLVEVGSVVRRLMLAKVLTKPRAAEAVADLKQLPLRLLAHRGLLDAAWAFAATASMYDATYLALAKLSSATLLTRDAKLARAHARQLRIRVV